MIFVQSQDSETLERNLQEMFQFPNISVLELCLTTLAQRLKLFIDRDKVLYLEFKEYVTFLDVSE